jgi:hypothetical protein
MGNAAQIEPDWDQAAQLARDYEDDRGANWSMTKKSTLMRRGKQLRAQPTESGYAQRRLAIGRLIVIIQQEEKLSAMQGTCRALARRSQAIWLGFPENSVFKSLNMR